MIIGIAGPAGSGKNEIANLIGRRYERVRYGSFALILKKMLNVLLDSTMKDWENREWKENPHPKLLGKSPRFAAQTLGSQWGRNIIGLDLWIHALDEAILSGTKFFVITDLRFNNEAVYIRNHGGVIIHVERPDCAIIDNPDHESERGIAQKGQDYIIINDCDLSTLGKRVYEITDNLT